MKVLILEDNAYDAELNLKTLHKESWAIDSRVAGDEASFVTYLADFDPDVILSDYNLPLFNGMDALRLSKVQKPLTPFIIVTGSLDEETAVECIKEGAWDYVLKEHLVRLNPAVKYALELREERRKRKAAEDKIIENEKLASRLLNNIQTGVFLVNQSSEILFSNTKAEQITGLPASGMLGKNLFRQLEIKDIHGEKIDEENNPAARVAKTAGELHDITYRYQTANGQNRWMNLCATPDNLSDGKVNQIIICFQDITEKLEIDNALKDSEIRYQAIFNSVNDGIFLYNPRNYGLVDVNDRLMDMYGYSKNEIVTLDVNDLSDTAKGYTKQLALEFAKDTIKGREQKREWIARHKNGNSFWVRVTLKMVMIGGKTLLMGIITDIDKEKLAEISLKESEEHYRALSQNSPDIIMRFDANCRHLFVNNTIVDQLGLKPELFIGKTHKEMGLFEESMCDFWEDQILKVFETKAPTEVEFALPLNGNIVYFEWRLFPEFNPAGEALTVLAVARNISFKKEAQEALRKSEERLELALEATSDGIWDLNLKTSEIYFSPRYATMLGYDPATFKNDISVFNDLIHPDDVEWVLSYLDIVKKLKQQTIDLNVRFRKQDGTYAFIQARGKVFSYGDDGTPMRIVGTNVDITHRRRQDEIQKAIFDIGNAVVTTRNLDELFEKIQEILGSIIDTKNCYIALCDENSDVITLPFHKDEKDSFTEFPAGKTITAYVIRTGKAQLLNPEAIEKLHLAGEIEAFGTPSVSWLGVPLKIDRKIIGVFTVQSYDESVKYNQEDVKILEFVSDQIALAISRKKDEDSIRENQLKLRRIIESSPDGLLVIGKDGTILDHNTSIFDILRIRNMELRMRNFLDFVIPSGIEKVKDIFNETIVSGYQKNNELLMIRDDDTEFYAEISLGLIQNLESVSETFVIIIKDITERISYEMNLKVAKERAEESDRLKSSFLSNMSHEIRTPMNAIVGFAELLSQDEVDDNDKKEFISHINQSSENLLNLIDDIIDISKIEAGQIRMNNSVFRLSSLLSDLHELFAKNLKRQNKSSLNIIIDNNGIDPEFNIVSDAFRLRQIFINLISNAIKFTEKGEVRFGIKSLTETQISFTVSDTGIGIPKDKQLVIFERFRQGHESNIKFYGGTGLGLAICKHLIELMGGNISVYSEPGKGSEFTFSIEYSKSDNEVAIQGKRILDEVIGWENKTILIAEDVTSNYIILQELLKNTKVNLIWAKDGREAVTLFRENPEIDLVLMDIQLPLIDGYQATAEIKKIRKDVPVIAQTAYAMAGEREKSLNAGCDDYISKPIKPRDLIALLSKYMTS